MPPVSYRTGAGKLRGVPYLTLIWLSPAWRVANGMADMRPTGGSRGATPIAICLYDTVLYWCLTVRGYISFSLFVAEGTVACIESKSASAPLRRCQRGCQRISIKDLQGKHMDYIFGNLRVTRA